VTTRNFSEIGKRSAEKRNGTSSTKRWSLAAEPKKRRTDKRLSERVSKKAIDRPSGLQGPAEASLQTQGAKRGLAVAGKVSSLAIKRS